MTLKPAELAPAAVVVVPPAFATPDVSGVTVPVPEETPDVPPEFPVFTPPVPTVDDPDARGDEEVIDDTPLELDAGVVELVETVILVPATTVLPGVVSPESEKYVVIACVAATVV